MSERGATRHKLEVAGSMPGLTSGCALFLQRVALVLIERERDHAHAGADGDLRANAGPATYVHLGKAGPGMSHNRL